METKCPECDCVLKPKKELELGEIFSCLDCGSRLEVMSLQPLKIQPAPVVEEDWGE
ncbi:lysine biosynthesis protein LysW [Candidatus Micrarchaeota archaeon]|nr:MAG: lysine biosynthesis protein LysW [Candidatus Micrarchaeota archaeon]